MFCEFISSALFWSKGLFSINYLVNVRTAFPGPYNFVKSGSFVAKTWRSTTSWDSIDFTVNVVVLLVISDCYLIGKLLATGFHTFSVKSPSQPVTGSILTPKTHCMSSLTVIFFTGSFPCTQETGLRAVFPESTWHNRTVTSSFIQKSESFFHLAWETSPRFSKVTQVSPRLSTLHVASDDLTCSWFQLHFTGSGDTVYQSLLEDQLYFLWCLQYPLDLDFVCSKAIWRVGYFPYASKHHEIRLADVLLWVAVEAGTWRRWRQ